MEPDGIAAELETGQSYARTMGFCHEEWLFNHEWVVDGRRFSFLQPVYSSRRRLTEGEKLNFSLWAIDRKRARVEVGYIRNCEIVTRADAAAALRAYESHGWLATMRAQVAALGGNVSGIDVDDPTLLFNIAFDPADAICLDYGQMEPLPTGHPAVGKRANTHYNLAKKPLSGPPSVPALASSIFRSLDEHPTIHVTTIREFIRNKEHNRLQNELHRFFNGIQAVRGRRHEDRIDFEVPATAGDWLFEVKVAASPMLAVREAIGQLLEYAYARIRANRPVAGLVVGSNVPSNRELDSYLEHLATSRGLRIHFVRIPDDLAAFAKAQGLDLPK